jgi:transcriptional regulator with XRE-family HTH domain
MRTFDQHSIKNLRIKLNLTLETFASRIGPTIKRQHVWNWEQGNNKPNVDTLAKMAQAFDVPIDYFFVSGQYSPNTMEDSL